MGTDDPAGRTRWERWLILALIAMVLGLLREQAFRANRERFGPPGPPPVTD